MEQKIYKGAKIYLVMNKRGRAGFDVADFWGLPYASTSYNEAYEFMRAIVDKALRIKNVITKAQVWKKEYFCVIKVDAEMMKQK